MRWWHDQLVTMELVLLWYKTRHRVGLVIQSLLLSTTQQPPNKPFTSLSNMPRLNSRTFQSASGVNTITRPVSKRSGGDYLSGQQVVVANLVSLWLKTNLLNLDSWYGLYRPPFDPGVQDSWNERLPLGSSPFQPQRVGEAPGARTKWSSSTILMENHQNGGDRSRGRREGHGRLYSIHEAFLSHRDEALEDVEGSRKPSKFLIVSWINSSPNIFLTGWLSWKPAEGYAEDPGRDGLLFGAERRGASPAPCHEYSYLPQRFHTYVKKFVT